MSGEETRGEERRDLVNHMSKVVIFHVVAIAMVVVVVLLLVVVLVAVKPAGWYGSTDSPFSHNDIVVVGVVVVPGLG